MEKAPLSDKVAQFFSSKGEHPVNVVGGTEEQWEQQEQQTQWHEEKQPPIWINNSVDQTDYKD